MEWQELQDSIYDNNNNNNNNNITDNLKIIFPIAYIAQIVNSLFSANDIECRLPRQRKGPGPGSYTPRDECIVHRT